MYPLTALPGILSTERESVDIFKPAVPDTDKRQRMYAGKEMIVCITFPASSHAQIEPSPCLVIFLGVKLIRLFNIQPSLLLRFFDERSFRVVSPGRSRGLRHSPPPADKTHHVRVGLHRYVKSCTQSFTSESGTVTIPQCASYSRSFCSDLHGRNSPRPKPQTEAYPQTEKT